MHQIGRMMAAVSAAAMVTASAWGQDLDGAIREALGAKSYSVQRLAPAAERGGTVRVRLVLRGEEVTAVLAPEPVQSDDCVMELHDGMGRVRIVPAPPSCTYQGEIAGVAGSICSGSIIDGGWTGVIVTPAGSWGVLPLRAVALEADPALHVITSQDDLLPGEWRCGVTGGAGPMGAARLAPGAATPAGADDPRRICELAIEADYPFYALVGGDASSVAQDVATVIANVNSYYWLSGIWVKCKVVRYVIRVTPQGNPGLYNTDDPGLLLTNFRTVWNNLAGGIHRDVAHMFTGRDLTGTVVGLAYQTTVCTTAWAYGVSQSRFTLQPGRRAALTAHELGHNFSAPHCDEPGLECDPCWIMSTVQGNTTNQLTRLGCSATLIHNYAMLRPCMSTGGLMMPPGCPADANGDGAVDANDLAAFQSAFAAGMPAGDADGDGYLTASDAAAFLASFARGCR